MECCVFGCKERPIALEMDEDEWGLRCHKHLDRNGVYSFINLSYVNMNLIKVAEEIISLKAKEKVV